MGVLKNPLPGTGLGRRHREEQNDMAISLVTPASGLVDKPIWVRVCVVVITRSGATW
jgi:hypothetical protein